MCPRESLFRGEDRGDVQVYATVASSLARARKSRFNNFVDVRRQLLGGKSSYFKVSDSQSSNSVMCQELPEEVRRTQIEIEMPAVKSMQSDWNSE
jgi:hypothetical protein